MNQTANSSSGLLLLTASDVESLLRDQEQDIVAVIRAAYRTHESGEVLCPESCFLHLPGPVPSRIIAMPAYVQGEFQAAGMKWISSFPANLACGLPRASAIVSLNSVYTGRAFALLEGSLISAKRTAASAALAVMTLDAAPTAITSMGVIGCGLINAEIVRFLSLLVPGLCDVTAFDTQAASLASFTRRIVECAPHLAVRPAKCASEVLSANRVTSIATTAVSPHIPSLTICPLGSLLLHISLRDIMPQALLGAGVNNIVDDADHSVRAGTSLELASTLNPGKSLIRTTLGRLLQGKDAARHSASEVTVFSPFGLAVLDIALAWYVYRAAAGKRGIFVPEFHPPCQAAKEESLATSAFDSGH
jgi:ornithine cyclodeaminase